MGDDDLMLPHALSKLSVPALSNLKPGIILRSWLKADRETLEVDENFTYFAGDRIFQPGMDAASSLFRRSVAIAGYTVRTDLARNIATDEVDGYLLYQTYLTGMICQQFAGYYVSEPLVIMRKDSKQRPTHFFGSAEVEKSRFQPGLLEGQHSLNFVEGMINTAKLVAQKPIAKSFSLWCSRTFADIPTRFFQFREIMVLKNIFNITDHWEIWGLSRVHFSMSTHLVF